MSPARRCVSLALSCLVVSSLIGGVLSPALADTTPPPWQPPGSSNPQADPNNAGTLAFFNANGNQITSGSINSIMGAYEQATFTIGNPVGGQQATLYAATPTTGVEGTWNNDNFAQSTFSPTGTYPGSIKASNGPVLTENPANDKTLTQHIATSPNTVDPSTGYSNTYEFRLYTTGSRGVGAPSGVRYASADVTVDLNAGTWSEIFPTVATPSKTSTTTTLSDGSTGSSTTVGTPVTFTSTTTTGVAGSVQLQNNGVNVGSAMAVDTTSGQATFSYTPSQAESDSFTAVFTPTDATTYGGSTSAAVALSVTKKPTTTSLSDGSTGPTVRVGTAVTFTSTTTTGVAGSVQLQNNGANVGSAVAVNTTSGQATFTYTPAQAETDSFTAVFTPTDTTTYSGSTSAAVALTATTKTPTMTSLADGATGSTTTVGTTVTFTSTTTTGVAGSVQLQNNGANVGSAVAVNTTSGQATFTYTPAQAETDSFAAVFTPTDTTTYSGSTSPAVALTVSKKPTTTSLSDGSAGSSTTVGTAVTFTSTTTTGVAGSVQLQNNGANVGSAVAVNTTTGQATFAYTPSQAESDSFTAAFTPSDTTTYSGSTSAAVALTVSTKPTTTSLSDGTTGTSSPAGTPVTFTSTTTIGVAGSVQLQNNGVNVGSAVAVTTTSGQATFTYTPATAENDSFTAVFTPTDATTYSGSTSAPVALTATQTATSVGLTSTASGQVNPGTAVTLTASPMTGGPGQVVFLDNGQPVANGTVAYDGTNDPMITYTPAAGTHSLTVSYTPTNEAFGASTSNPITITEGSLPTSVTLSSTPAGQASLGTPVTLSATASPGVPGSVTFFSGTTGVATIPVNAAGTAASVVLPAVGSYYYSAVFTPSDATTYASATSGTLLFSVVRSQPVVTAQLLTAKPVYGRKPLVQVTVVAPGAVPTGTVLVFNAGKLIAFGKLANGSTIFTLPGNLQPGSKSLDVAYGGDGNVLSGATPLHVTVEKASSTTVLRPATGRISSGTKLKVTVLVRVDGFVPNGRVSIIIKHKIVAYGIYRHGYVTITLPRLPAGTYEYHARYTGNSAAAGSSSRSHLVIVD